MKHYGVQIKEGTDISNATVDSGVGFPAGANIGELFFLTSGTIGLYVYTGAQWSRILNDSAAFAFLDLTDTPSSYAGRANNVLSVSATETGIEFVSPSDIVNGLDVFELGDVPDYTGNAGKCLAVNLTENGIEYITAGSGSSTFIGLNDTPGGYAGHTNKVLTVAPGENAVVFTSPSVLANDINISDLNDVPDFAGEANNYLIVNPTEDGVAFTASGPGGGATAYTGLTDTPSTLSGDGLKLLQVNGGETDIVHTAPANVLWPKLRVESTDPHIIIDDTNGSSNANVWRISNTPTTLKFQTMPTNESSTTDFITLSRQGATPFSVDFGKTVMLNFAESTQTLSVFSSFTTLTFNLDRVFNVSLFANTTMSFNTGGLTTGRAVTFTVILKQPSGGNMNVTWPASVKWTDGSAPSQTLTGNAIDMYTFVTHDAGASYYGFLTAPNLS